MPPESFTVTAIQAPGEPIQYELWLFGVDEEKATFGNETLGCHIPFNIWVSRNRPTKIEFSV